MNLVRGKGKSVRLKLQNDVGVKVRLKWWSEARGDGCAEDEEPLWG